MPITPTGIPKIMRAHGWSHGAALMETWLARAAAVGPAYGAPVTRAVRMDWVLTFRRAKEAYERLLQEQGWLDPEGRRRIGKQLARKKLLTAERVAFGRLSRQVEEIDQLGAGYACAADVAGWPALDDLSVALGDFELRVAVAGTVEPVWWTRRDRKQPAEPRLVAHRVTIAEVGVYARGSYDFNVPRPLGCWNVATDAVSWGDESAGEPLTTGHFRRWREQQHLGGDFLVYSDIKRTKLPSEQQRSFTIQSTDWLSAQQPTAR